MKITKTSILRILRSMWPIAAGVGVFAITQLLAIAIPPSLHFLTDVSATDRRAATYGTSPP